MIKLILAAFAGLTLLASASNAQTYVRRDVSCASKDQKFRTCETGLIQIDRLMLDRQRSDASCVEGRSYYVDNQTRIAVTDGCRGDFQVEGYTYNVKNGDDVIAGDPRYPRNPYREQETLRCESIDGRDRTCYSQQIRRVERVTLVRQISNANCIPNRTFFALRNGVRVTDGCRGDFTLRGLPY